MPEITNVSDDDDDDDDGLINFSVALSQGHVTISLKL